MEALRARFLRNYWAIYVVLLGSWLLRLIIGTEDAAQVRDRLRIGPFPFWMPLAALVTFLLAVLFLLTKTRGSRAEVEEDHWRIEP